MKLIPLATNTPNGRAVAIFLVMIMTIASFVGILGMAGAESDGQEKVTAAKPLGLQPGQRSGEWDLAKNPPEYRIEPSNYYEGLGAQMLKMDLNGDGYKDLVVAGNQYSYYSSGVRIFDGKTQLTYPNLKTTGQGAKWKIDWGYDYNGYSMGRDLAIGDVNGDGYDDIAFSSCYYSSPYGNVYIYYGGPNWDSRSTVYLSSADVRLVGQNYDQAFGKGLGIGHINNDKYGDVIVCGAYSYSYIWFGSSTMSGTKYYSSADITIYTNYLGNQGVATGDMNNDGLDEIAFCSSWVSSSVYVMSPTSGITNGISITAGSSSAYANWVVYTVGGSYAGCYPALIEDYNGDGYGDLIVGAPVYKKGYVYVVNGKATLPTGSKTLYSTGNFDIAFYSSEAASPQYYNPYFGTMAFGDYDGDGLKDLALGCSNPGRVYVLLNNQLVAGEYDVKSIATLTIKAPSSSSYFGGLGYGWNIYYYYYYYNPMGIRQICFWDRDGDGCDDIFIGDHYKTTGNYYQAGMIYGVTPFNMIAIGNTEILSGDLPDDKTFYAEYKYYGIKGSVMNRWNPAATEYFHFKFIMGPYSATFAFTPADGMKKTDDPLNIMEMEPGRLNVTIDYEKKEMMVEFWFKFTLNMSVEYPVSLETFIKVAHITYTSRQDIGRVRHNFMYVGDMKAYLYDKDKSERIRELELGEWIAENQSIEFSGPKLIYNGTQNFWNDFTEYPYCPANHLFKILGSSSLFDEVYDDSSSNRSFQIIMRGGDLPVLMDYKFEQLGIPTAKVLNAIPGFYISVDVDTPGIPAGIRIHADSFDDGNTIVDNEGELYITWGIPAEYNSGIDHYEVTVTGIDDPIETPDNFVKVDTPSDGVVVASIRAIDRVGHVGSPGSGSIKIEKQGLSFTNPVPAAGTWHNGYSPDVGFTITDEGGDAVIGNTVEYSVSYDSGETWGPWIGAGNTFRADTIMVTVNPVLLEGSLNMVRFRAQDEAGNIGESTDPIQVNVDVSDLEFSDVMLDGKSDWVGTWIDDEETVVTFTAKDILSGIDATTIEYRYTTRSRSDLELTAWSSTGVIVGEDGTVTLPKIEFSMGDRNHIQFRGRDMAGNPLTYSKAYNIWVNTMPSAVLSSPEDRIEVLEGTMLRFDGTLSRDYDGDALTYTWIDTTGIAPDTKEETIGADAADPARFDLVLGVGEHSIRLKVSDGIHEVESKSVHVKVIAIIEPEWMTLDDNDGDGLPNLYEYIYHLGWNDAENKDSAFEPGYWGKSKEDILKLVGEKYKNGEVEANAENDFDGDSHTDYEEWLWNTNPTDVNDFPVYEPEGKAGPEAVDTLLMVLIVVAIIVIIAVIIVLALNSMAIRRKLSEEAAQAAHEEQAHVQRLLEGGGNQKLAALKAASEGKAVLSLPSPMATQDALPMGEPVPAAAMTAQPIAATPAGWVAAPAAEPGQSGQYANINNGTNVPPN